jgi:pheromone shutdown-related protein TraB
MTEIVLIPTSHIARGSVENVRKIIESAKPDCIALELDINRYHALQREGGSNFEVMKSLGFVTFLIYWLLKKFQNFFGKKTGILPGSEMLKGVEMAKNSGAKIAFIDQDIRSTFFGIKNVPFGEKLKLLWLLIKAGFGIAIPFGKKEQIDLNKVPPEKLIEQAMDFFREELPEFYKVLVDDRNKVMVNNLIHLSKKFEKIVCIIGAGHEGGMKELLTELRKNSLLSGI